MGSVCAKRGSGRPTEAEDSGDSGSDEPIEKVPCRTCTQWNQFLHDHRGMGLSPQDFSALYWKARICNELSDDSPESTHLRAQTVVRVKHGSNIFAAEANLSADVKKLKQDIFDKTKIKIHHQQLSFQGNMLQMGSTVSSYNVREQSLLNLTVVPENRSAKSRSVRCKSGEGR